MVALSSGGKDSTLALHLAWKRGYKASLLLTMLPEDPESMLYHTHNVHHVKKIAESIGVDWGGYPAKKENEATSLKEALKETKADVFITGGIASRYQKDRFDRVASELDIIHYAPLWGWEPKQVLKEVVRTELEAIMVAVASLGLDESWLGARLTEEKIQELLKASEKYRFNATGEGGDFETFVLNAPLFRKKLRIVSAEKRWMGDRGVFEIRQVELVDKE